MRYRFIAAMTHYRTAVAASLAGAIILYTTVAGAAVTSALTLERASVAPGKQTELRLVIAGAPDAAPPEIPFVNGLYIRYQDSKKGTAQVDGGPVPAVAHTYRVVGQRLGSYTIGPVPFVHDGISYRTNIVTLTVAEEAPDLFTMTTEQSREEGDIAEHIYLTLDAPKTTVYTYEELPVRLRLFSDWFDLEDIVISDIRSGDIISPPFTKTGSSVDTIGGTRFAILAYETILIPPTAGTFTLEPVTATFAIAKRQPLPSGELPPLLNDNERFYLQLLGANTRLPMEIETPPFELQVRPLPAAGRPETFKGAVGAFTFIAMASPRDVAVGDTVTVRMTIAGAGNFNTLTGIEVPPIEGAKAYEPRLTRGHDRVMVEQAFRVDSPDVTAIPAITFSFFDPVKGEYLSQTQGPFPLAAIGGPQAAEPTRDEEAVPFKLPFAEKRKPATRPTDELVPMKASLGRLVPFDPVALIRPLPVIIVFVLPIIALLIAMLIKRRMTFLATDLEYANWLRASKQASADLAGARHVMRPGREQLFYDRIFTLMQQYLGSRLFVPPEGITEKTAREILSDKIADPAIIHRITSVFADCHLARFSAIDNIGKEEMLETLKKASSVIDSLNKQTYIIKK